jgi:general secretion pathway protein N
VTVLNRWWWVAVGVGAYLAFAIHSFPAGTAFAWFAPDAVRLAGIRGTLWSGSAAAGSVGDLALHDLSWSVRPASLLRGRLTTDFEAQLADGFVKARASATPSRIELTDLRASTSLQTLSGVLPLQGVRGLMSAQLASLRLEHGAVTAIVGELRLAGVAVRPFMASASGQLLALGSYIVRFMESPGDGVAASFNDTEGPLEVSGTATLDPERRYMIDSLIKPRPDAPPELVDGLKIMTEDPDAEGRRRLTLTGSL